MTGILWAVILCVALLLAMLLCPWHIRVTGGTSPPSGRAQLRLLGGYAPPIPIPLRPSPQGRTPRRARKRRAAKRHRPPKGTGALVRGILSACRLHHLRVAGRIGLDDPADTGQLWALIVPLAQALRGPRRDINLAPEFSGPCLDVEATGDIAILPLRLMRTGVAFVWANRRTA